MKGLITILTIFILVSCGSIQTEPTEQTSENKAKMEEESIAGKVETISINDLSYELKPISKKSFEKRHNKMTTIPNEEIIDDAENVVRNGEKLTFKLTNGQSKTLKNNLDNMSDQFVKYQYVQSYGFVDYWLVYAVLYEGHGYGLVDKQTGETNWVWGIPVFAPNNKSAVCYSLDIIAGFNPNGIQLFKRENKKLVLAWDKQFDDWGPSKIKWADNSTLFIEQKRMNPQPSDEDMYVTEYKSMEIR